MSVQSRFAETRFADTPTLTLTLTLNPNFGESGRYRYVYDLWKQNSKCHPGPRFPVWRDMPFSYRVSQWLPVSFLMARTLAEGVDWQQRLLSKRLRDTRNVSSPTFLRVLVSYTAAKFDGSPLSLCRHVTWHLPESFVAQCIVSFMNINLLCFPWLFGTSRDVLVSHCKFARMRG